MQDLTERLDAELSTAPAATFEATDTLSAGRRAVRRRRLAVGAAGLAVAVVVGGGATLALDGWGVRAGRDGAVAGDPTSTPSVSPNAVTTGDVWPDGELLRLGRRGAVEVNPDADVIERVDFTASDGTTREIFHLDLDGREYYALADFSSYSSVPLPAQGLSLRAWAEQLLTQDEDDAGSEQSWVSIDGRSRLTPEPGIELVAWRPDPDLGPDFAPLSEPTAVAHVIRDGVHYFIAVRRLPDGTTEAIPYHRDDRIRTLEAFLSYARDQYATNDEGGSEGLR